MSSSKKENQQPRVSVLLTWTVLPCKQKKRIYGKINTKVSGKAEFPITGVWNETVTVLSSAVRDVCHASTEMPQKCNIFLNNILESLESCEAKKCSSLDVMTLWSGGCLMKSFWIQFDMLFPINYYNNTDLTTAPISLKNNLKFSEGNLLCSAVRVQ